MEKLVDSGFTIVEMVVTLAVAAVFMVFFFQMYLTTESQRIAVNRQAAASDLSYANLRKFASRPTVPCSAAMDLTTAGNHAGVTIGTENDTNPNGNTYGFVAESTASIPSLTNVHQTVKIYAPKGCVAATYNANPVKIESTITYGTNGDTVTHVSFVN